MLVDCRHFSREAVTNSWYENKALAESHFWETKKQVDMFFSFIKVTSHLQLLQNY